MKQLIIAVVCTAAMGGIVWFGPQLSKSFNSVKVEQNTIIEEKEVVKDNLDLELQQRIEAEMERINTEAEEVRQQYVDNELNIIEGEFWRDIAARAEEKAIEKEKQSQVY